MKTFKTMLIAAAIASPLALVAGTASAQVNGIAVADPNAAIANSRAWQAAKTQIQTQYKTQIDQAEARRQAIANELNPLITAFNTARSAPNANQASLQTQAQAIQTKEQAGQAELQRLTLPASRAQAYAIEQIQSRLEAAVNAAVRARNVSLLLRPDAALFAQPAADITAAVTAELDKSVPSVNTTPPANWQPGQGQTGANATSTPATATPANNNRRNQGR